ncbi:MAG TPA: hypothetical protein VKY59_20660 [Spirillospora sp.]|jgi:hypothetical protein|nr:hypothetical protein [Spirillospora sp.]
MIRYTGIVLLILLALSGAAQAQTGGQFCVRAFEDRNANGTMDAGEPLLTGGISADLLNAENVVVGSALLSESPNRAQGVICFQFLAPGQYSLIITSADYVPTTPNTVTASITEGTLPTVVEFGGQRLVLEPAASATQAGDVVGNLTALANLDRDTLPRIVLSALGSLVVIAGMVVLGAIIYLLVLRRPAQPAYYPSRPPTTGGLKPVEPEEIEEEIEEEN